MFGRKNRHAAERQDGGPEADQIRLKAFLGLRPGVYLTALYGLIILAALFFILLYPGLSRPGSVAVLKTEPAGAALRVDGLYMGTSPDRIFVPRGLHTFELVLPGFESLQFEDEIQGRVFGSAIFPRLYRIEKKLTAPDPRKVLALGAADYAAWSFAGEPTAAFQIPLSLSRGAYLAGPAAKDPETLRAMNDILRAAARFGTTRAALRDLTRAKLLIDNGGLSPSPGSIFRSAGDLIGFLSETPGAAAWLAAALPPEAASLVAGSSWYEKQNRAGDEAAAAEKPAPGPGGRFRLGPLDFTALPGGVLVPRSVFPRPLEVEDFFMAPAEVSAAAFRSFLAARPQWSRENLETLRGQNQVTGDYLAGLSGGSAGDGQGVSHVSWYAAGAFCAWLSEQLPPSMTGWEVRLPTETEWEYAARSVRDWASPDITGLSGSGW
jgi:hypothetical protein